MKLFNFLKKSQAPIQGPKAYSTVNGYEAATYSRDRSYISTPTEETIVNPGEFTRHEITRLSRYLICNYPLAERIASLCEIYGVGAGISANATTPDATFNENATNVFSQWAGTSFCTSDNELNLYEVQRVLARELLVCGEVFLVLIKTQNDYPQLMLVRSENVRHSGDKADTSVDGIYFDAYGKALAYNVFTGDTYQKIDASNVVHVKRAKNIGQKRGIGLFASSLNAMRDHKDMHVLIKRSLKTQLALAAVVKKKTGEAGTTGAFGALTNLDPQTQAPTTTGRTNQALERVFGGNVTYLQPGEEVDLVSSENPTENVREFLELITRDVCLSVSLPYSFVVNADKMNGTAMRFDIGDAAFFFGSLQNILIDGGLNRVYGWVIASFIKSGKLQAPPEEILPWAVSWTKPISVTVDQQRQTNIDIALLQNSLTTFETYYSARGKDWKEELRQRAREEAFLDELSKETGVSINRLRALQAGSPALTEPEEASETAPAPPALQEAS